MKYTSFLALTTLFLFSCSSAPQQEAIEEEAPETEVTESTIPDEVPEITEDTIVEEKAPFVLSTELYEIENLICSPSLDSAMKEITVAKMSAYQQEMSQYNEADGPFEARSYSTELGDSTGRYACVTTITESCGATCSYEYTSYLVINMFEDGWCYRKDLKAVFGGKALKLVHLADREQLLIFATDMRKYHIFAEYTMPKIYLMTLDGEQTIQQLNFSGFNYCKCLEDNESAVQACAEYEETGGWQYSVNSYDQENETLWFSITNLEIWRNEEGQRNGDKVLDFNFIIDLKNEEIRRSY